MRGSSSSSRLSKRSRASDAAPNEVSHTEDDRAKRRRFSQGEHDGLDSTAPELLLHGSTGQDGNTSVIDEVPSQSFAEMRAPWTLSQLVAGQYSNIEPVFSSDEKYIFLAAGSAVYIYSTVTSLLVQTLHVDSNQKIIGYKLFPAKQDCLYAFTSNGSIRTWEWTTGKQISHWDMCRAIISIDLGFSASDSMNHTFYCLCERSDGKREIRTFSMHGQKPSESVILETSTRFSHLRVSRRSQTIIAYGGHCLLLGFANSPSHDMECTQYTWRETTLPVTITCLDVRQSTQSEQQDKKSGHATEQLDLVVGEAGGAILIYQDVLGLFLTCEGSRDGSNGPAVRRLHWHRGPVNALRWSRDGNYIISGGNESVLVLWQLDTGRKQFLPHLSSPICDIVISPAGNSYAVKLADNCVVVLSARELQPYATITGLQLSPRMARSKHKIAPQEVTTAAVLHPKYPSQLLVAIPASRQGAQDGFCLANPVLQTFDIRANSHISRQALSRTNTTVLKISPEGSEISTPDIKYLDISQDGKWMATFDSWAPHSQDVKGLGLNDTGNDATTGYQENYLKFWKWNGSSTMWELVTRIDNPHASVNGVAPVLGLASRPRSNDFATIGADAKLRIWYPNMRSRAGLKAGSNATHQLETWKCRNIIDMKGNLTRGSYNLTTACLAFSEDGSVLAVCLPSGSSANPGAVVLIDAQECAIRYSRIGTHCGDPCAVKFLGRHLVVASNRFISVWDTVDDLVRVLEPSLDGVSGGKSQQLLAVNLRTRTFAVTAKNPQNSVKKSRALQIPVKVYDIETLTPVFSCTVGKPPVTLLSDSYSGDYIIIDSAAGVQRVGCLDKPFQPTARSHELSAMPTQLNSGLMDLFGDQGPGIQQSSLPHALDKNEASEQAGGVSDMFSEVPSFVLPPVSVLFRNVVQSLC